MSDSKDNVATQARRLGMSSAVLHRDLGRNYPVMVRGEGNYVFDGSGKRYLDAMGGGAAVATIGYGVPEVIEAAHKQISALPFTHNQKYTHPTQEALAERILQIAPKGMARVQFTCSGSEANEAAQRLARLYHLQKGNQGKWRFICYNQSFHGVTMANLGLTGRPSLRQPFEPYIPQHIHMALPHPHRCPYGSEGGDASSDAAVAAIEKAIEEHGPDTIAGIFFEPISGSSAPGLKPSDSYFPKLAELCRKYDLLLIMDEIITGAGRTGRTFGADHWDICPDILTTAKGLGAGYAPIGAVLIKDSVFDVFSAAKLGTPHGHTFNGNPVSCAVGLAVLDYLATHDLIEKSRETGAYLRDQLRKAIGDLPIVGEVRGHGMLIGIEYVRDRDSWDFLDPALGFGPQIDKINIDKGLLTYSMQTTRDGFFGDQTMIGPSFTLSREQADEVVATMASTVREAMTAAKLG